MRRQPWVSLVLFVIPFASWAGTWSPEALLKSRGTEQFLAPIHGSLLPNGKVILMGNQRDIQSPVEGGSPYVESGFTAVLDPSVPVGAAPTYLNLEAPPLRTHSDPSVWFADSLFCSGHTFTEDGLFVTFGGTRFLGVNGTPYELVLGTGYSTVYDSAGAGSWTSVADEYKSIGPFGTNGKWYPSATRLSDGRILVTSGFELPFYLDNKRLIAVQLRNMAVELFTPDPAQPQNGTFQMVSPSDPAQTPVEIWNSDYTHVFQLYAKVGEHSVLMLGEQGFPVFLNPNGAGPGKWRVSANRRPGADQVVALGHQPSEGASTVLLPLRLDYDEWGYLPGSVLVAGGSHDEDYQKSLHVYDPFLDSWPISRTMATGRHHPSTVILPDGRILILAGHNERCDAGPRHAELVDPKNGFQIAQDPTASIRTRGYHSVSVLLPDGRVLVTGGRPGGPFSEQCLAETNIESVTYEYYSPDYMTRPRPVIDLAPETIRYGEGFGIYRSGPNPPAEAVLIGLGSMTHSIDMNQRYVQLAMLDVPAWGVTWIVGPANREVAPAGHYMLFILDANRVPSVAKIVKLE